MNKILSILVCLLIFACGVKPGQVSAPEDAEEKAFPREYPNIKKDPKH